MKFKDPCKRCIVRASCGQICADKIEYGDSIPSLESISSITIMLGLTLPLSYLLAYMTNSSELNQFCGAIINAIGVVLICAINILLLTKTGKYFINERETYLNQQMQDQMREHERLNKQYNKIKPLFPKNRTIP